jgi:hypothetical protein
MKTTEVRKKLKRPSLIVVVTTRIRMVQYDNEDRRSFEEKK